MQVKRIIRRRPLRVYHVIVHSLVIRQTIKKLLDFAKTTTVISAAGLYLKDETRVRHDSRPTWLTLVASRT